MAHQDHNDLRFGYTTGACATAATKAAAIALFTGALPSQATITLPRGEIAMFDIVDGQIAETSAIASVQKDAGDDPDVTHGAIIQATVELQPPTEQLVTFYAGPGVGMVTKPGLPIAPGEPAINPVPRTMLTSVLTELAAEHDYAGAFDVTISVPGGAELALQTWNPRLGIEGGISILGTTGIVRPFSCAAWIASIHRGIDVVRANGVEHAIASTGATSEASAQRYFDAPDHAMLDMGDFAGGLLKYLRRHPVPRLTIAGGFGKLTKLAQGALDLHSSRSQVDFEALGDLATGLVADKRAVTSANTAKQALDIAGAGLAARVAENARRVALATLRDAPISVDVLVVARDGALIAQATDRGAQVLT